MATRLSFVCLLLLVTLIPLPFGAFRPWSWSVLGLWVGFVLLAWSRSAWLHQVEITWSPKLRVPTLLFSTVLLWAIAQSFAPLPASLANPIWQMTTDALGTEAQATISLAPDAGYVSIMRLLSYGGVFFLALQVGGNPQYAKRTLLAIAWSSVVYALYGLLNLTYGNDFILWYPRWAYHDDVTSTFVNRNTYAAYAALGLIVALSIAIRSFSKSWANSDRSLPRPARAIECFSGRPLVYTVLSILIGIAWVQSHSRMGFAAGCGGLVTLAILVRPAKSLQVKLVLISATAALVGLLLTLSGSKLVERITGTQEIDRLSIFSLTLRAISDAPWTGYGYGSFDRVFQIYRDLSKRSAVDVTQAHNTYLELALELGIPAAVLLVLSVAWLVALCIKGALGRRRMQEFPAIAVAASAVIGLHSLLDFSIQIPAVAALYATLLGLGVAQSVTAHRDHLVPRGRGVAGVLSRNPAAPHGGLGAALGYRR